MLASDYLFGFIPKAYALPSLAGLLLLLFGMAMSLIRKDIGVNALLVVLLGGGLMAANVIQSFKVGTTGIDFETLKNTTTQVSDVIDAQGKAISDLNNGLKSISKAIAEIVDRQKQFAAQLPQTPLKDQLVGSIDLTGAHQQSLDRVIVSNAQAIQKIAPLNLSIQQQLKAMRPPPP